MKLKNYDDEEKQLYYDIGICSLKEYNEYVVQQEEYLSFKELLYISKFLIEFVKNFANNEIYHSDIKPENLVMVRKQDDKILIKVIDFGVASSNYEYVNGYTYNFFHSNKRKYYNYG